MLFLVERDGLKCNICKGNLRKQYLRYQNWYKKIELNRANRGLKPRSEIEEELLVLNIERKGININLDHLKPKYLGGTWDFSNLVLTHTECNLEKGSRPIFTEISKNSKKKKFLLLGAKLRWRLRKFFKETKKKLRAYKFLRNLPLRTKNRFRRFLGMEEDFTGQPPWLIKMIERRKKREDRD